MTSPPSTPASPMRAARPSTPRPQGVDGGVAATFGDQVKDLIVNQTSDTTPAVAVDFASADSEAAGQFDSLF